MTTFLLDVNVLIALVDKDHVHHRAATDWFASEGHKSWATCPIVENGLLRIVGSPKYKNGPGTPALVADVLRKYRALPGHHFWPDQFSLLDEDFVDYSRLLTAAHITDTYLLALAKKKGSRLATLDRRLSTSAVLNGAAHLKLIEGPVNTPPAR